MALSLLPIAGRVWRGDFIAGNIAENEVTSLIFVRLREFDASCQRYCLGDPCGITAAAVLN